MDIFQLAFKIGFGSTPLTDSARISDYQKFMTNQQAASMDKQAYETPVLLTHGNVRDLTLGTAGAPDGDNVTSV